jgi:hypothetical protein
VDDPVYSWTRDTKYFQIVKTNWLVKTLVAQELEKAKEDQQEILHTLKIFEGKFAVVCSTMFGVRIVVSHVTGAEGKGK